MNFSSYYERYWLKEVTSEHGFANSPPEWNITELNRILKIVRPYLQGKVLDVGCGDGFFINGISALANIENCFGIDISRVAIGFAKRKYPRISYQVAAATAIPFKSKIFDSITVIEVVEHVFDIETLFIELNRVLKMAGVLVITTTDFNLLKKVLVSTIFWEKYFYPTNPHIRFFSKRSLTDVLTRSGFKVIVHRWNGSYLGIMPKGQIMIGKKVKEIYKVTR